jgi:hypothetical protein
MVMNQIQKNIYLFIYFFKKARCSRPLRLYWIVKYSSSSSLSCGARSTPMDPLKKQEERKKERKKE